MDGQTEIVGRPDAGPASSGPLVLLRKLFCFESGASDRLLPRWIFLRALGLIYFSAFFALVFQIRGLIGPHGILPAGQYLELIARQTGGVLRYWHAPSLLWLASGPHMLLGLCWVGMIASLLLVANVWPRGMLAICFVCFLSFVSAASVFSDYQSDGMLLEAGFVALFFAPGGFWPGLGAAQPPSRFSLFLLQWEWFRIYFESGLVKLLSGDPQWRNFTAMDQYYQNCPLPTWIGWYVQHLPHWFQAATAGATLVMELGLVWMICLPRRFRLVRIFLFFFVTCWQAGVILTANYAFLNYLVLSLGILLVDDRFVSRWIPKFWRLATGASDGATARATSAEAEPGEAAKREGSAPVRAFRTGKLVLMAAMLCWLFYASSASLVWLLLPRAPLPVAPMAVLQPFRVAEQYGLFAVMTRQLYQVEFQGSEDGVHWTAYPFRYKPQAVGEPPRIYAPYQPRFDWNLWFASLDNWRDNPFVIDTEIGLLMNNRPVLSLFAGNPFARKAPLQVRAVLWQYWFTTTSEKRNTGDWWRRKYLGLYAPTLQLEPNGIAVVALPSEGMPSTGGSGQ